MVNLLILDGPAKDSKRKALFDTVEILDRAPPARKAKTTAMEVEESDKDEPDESQDIENPQGEPHEDGPEAVARRLFGDLGIYSS